MILRFFFRVLDLFYRRTQLGHSIPQNCPLLLVANHPNGLVDPILMARIADRKVKMLAKAPIFKMPVLGWMAKRSGAIPIYRAQDGDKTESNRGVFDAVHAELAGGGAVLLFPEGISHNLPGLQKLKTGAARMALGAEALAGISMGTKVVPVGIVYRDKTKFGSSVAVEIGEAIEVDPFIELWKQDQRLAATALTEQIAVGLKKVMLELEEWEDLPLLQFASDVIGNFDDHDKHHPVQRLRQLAAFGKHQASNNPQQLRRLRKRLIEFSTRLHNLGLKVKDLDVDYSLGNMGSFLIGNLIAAFIGLPVAIIGTCFWFIPWAISTIALRLINPTADIVATVKVLAACLFFPIWAGTCWWYSPLNLGFNASLFVVLAACGLYARHFLRRRNSALRELRVFFMLPWRKRLKILLQREREQLRSLLQG